MIQEFGLPSVVMFASTSERTIDGYELDDACRRLADQGADVVGLNCSRGPATLLPILERVRAAVDCHVAALPVPYRTTPEQPTFQSLRDADGSARLPDRARSVPLHALRDGRLRRRRDRAGRRLHRLCCGGAPHHVRSMAERLGRTVPASRYSPDMARHPVLGEDVREQAAKFANWKD